MVVFEDARRKVERAEAHIREIKTRINSLHESNTARVDINTETGGEILVHDFADTAAFDTLALPLGDAVHNLNCALDYLWLQTIKSLAPALVNDRAKMPVRKSAEEIKGWLTHAGIDSASNFFRFIVDTIQPYGGGNEAIWAVHNFDIRDKHRLLIPILSHAFITGIVVVDQHGERWPGTGSSAEFQRPPYVMAFEPGLHVKEKGDLSAEIIVTDSKSGCEMTISDELAFYPHAISQTIVAFEKFVMSEMGG
jgi:hypothetical protein